MKVVLTCFGADSKLQPRRSRLLLSLRGCSWLLLSLGAWALTHGFASNNIFAAANIEWHILQIVVIKLTCLGNPELMRMRSQAVEEKVQGANPGIKDLRQIGAHLGAPLLHSSGPVPFGALVVGEHGKHLPHNA